MGLVVVLAVVPTAFAWAARPTGPDPAVERWPRWPYPVTCGDLDFDPAAAFSRPTQAERDSGAAELALRSYLKANAATGIPQRHWRRIAGTSEQVEFVHGYLGDDGGLPRLVFALQDGGWETRGPGWCGPRTVRNGVTAIDWTLYPDAPPPASSARSIVVGIHEHACTSGRDPIPHLQRPYLRYGRKAVLIMFWTDPVEGPALCLGNPIGRFELKLPGPLGQRQLYDAATYPPRPVEPGEDPRLLR